MAYALSLCMQNNTQNPVAEAVRTRTVIGTSPPSAPLSLVTVFVHREGPKPGGKLDGDLEALERALGWSEGSLSK
jgi:hypothetical protein